MKSSVLSGVLAAAALSLVLAACGSSGGGDSSPAAPSNSSPSNVTLITILGEKGAGSFTPNPAPSGVNSLEFKNTDTETHHIVANDNSFDSGDILPGATSKVVSMSTDGTNYHCTIHPLMIGAVNASSGAPPDCRGAYCLP
ncbi:MAG TPA: hypothetical protein VLT86_05000 [Vicinamibacterales bacterium]|nr:hypothetical protein [Vicinamibacterales bacterium]